MEEKKLRYSYQRDSIYNYIKNTKTHPSAEAIYTVLKSNIPDLSLGTVYRNLKQLIQLGKIKTVMTPESTERYEADLSNHAHFICSSCCKIIDLPLDSINMLNKHSTLPNGVLASSFELTVHGLCKDCSKTH